MARSSHRPGTRAAPRLGRIAAALAVTALLAAGCADDGGQEQSGDGQAAGLPRALQGKEVNDHGSAVVAGESSSEVVLDDLFFEPTVLVGSPGQSLELEVTNEGSATHNFTVPGQDVDVDLAPDESVMVTVTFPDTGSTEFLCRFHVSQGMRGALALEGDGGAGSSGSGGSGGGYVGY